MNIFTDGSSFSSPRTGGIGVRFIIIDSSGEEKIRNFDFDGYPNATNNQMELHAVIVALKEVIKLDLTSQITKITIYTDSRYVVDNYKKAIFEWPKTRWCSYSGRPILNANLWKVLIKSRKKIGTYVDIKWIRGHSKNEHNRAVDKLARVSARNPFNKPLTFVSVRRKQTNKSVEVGSVEMINQRITIRIITSEKLQVQKLWKYKYEVISKHSKYHGNIDIIFSEHFLSTGHTYFVKFNSDKQNPRIKKVFWELTLPNNN